MNLDPKKPLYKCQYCGHEETLLQAQTLCGNCGKPIHLSYVLRNSREKTQKLLFVDDRTKRIHWALENFPDYDVTIATCVPEALREMCKQDFDVISLDHDLNGYDFQDPDTPTCGMEIVRYLKKTGWTSERNEPIFWIHSSNLFAAHLMIVSLREIGFVAYYKPITYKVENMHYDKKGIPE